MYHLSAHTPRRRGRVPSFRHPCGAHPSNQPSPTNLKLNSRPRGRRDAGDLHHARAPLLRFLAVTTLVATLSQETPEGPSRPAVVLLSAEDVAERPLDSVHTPGLLPWAAMLGRESSTESSAPVLDLRGAHAPLFHWYVRRRLPFDGQLRQNVVETDVRSPRRSCSPDKASRA